MAEEDKAPKKDSDAKGPDDAAAGAAQASETKANGKGAKLSVLAQYIKDLSFENPQAPRSLGARQKSPAININVNVNANPMTKTDFDVVLSLDAEAKDGDTVLFRVELIYGGVFRIVDFPKEHVLPLLFIECPRLLFPFARQIVSDATRNGGFPPLMIDPIDFAQMFARRMAEEKTRTEVAANLNN